MILSVPTEKIEPRYPVEELPTHFNKKVDLPFVPHIGVEFILSSGYIKEVEGIVTKLEYWLESDELYVTIDVNKDNFEPCYFWETGWKDVG